MAKLATEMCSKFSSSWSKSWTWSPVQKEPQGAWMLDAWRKYFLTRNLFTTQRSMKLCKGFLMMKYLKPLNKICISFTHIRNSWLPRKLQRFVCKVSGLSLPVSSNSNQSLRNFKGFTKLQFPLSGIENRWCGHKFFKRARLMSESANLRAGYC
jgi:hypothetical protein